ncbi:MAG: DUF4258 domain-containing protein [Kiritimatiellae bacterium]|nr:DUF4258 domain-containing protein [Kiritimatiellia bacterium]
MERGIALEWINAALQDQDKTEEHEDGTRHFIKQVSECGNRWLRVVVNITENPNRRVTVFFDRRLRKEI